MSHAVSAEDSLHGHLYDPTRSRSKSNPLLGIRNLRNPPSLLTLEVLMFDVFIEALGHALAAGAKAALHALAELFR